MPQNIGEALANRVKQPKQIDYGRSEEALRQQVRFWRAWATVATLLLWFVIIFVLAAVPFSYWQRWSQSLRELW